MELYPAVDIEGGRVARSTSASDPIAAVRQFARDGARWVHVVDLDRAFGKGENRELTRRLLAEAAVRIQVGGGVTSDDGVAELVGWGATRVVIGTAGAVDAVLVARLLGRYGAERLAVGIDARDGRVAARGSDVRLALAPLELARRLRGQGARTVIYTDAARDGSLAGPDVDGARAIAALGEGLDVIVSGGVASLDDLRRVRDAGLAGAIVGRALHEGRFTLHEALTCIAA
ncbi:MAG TPA: 1-(5-phosphoribosyl)-5-[(5-phosphoribosylamino)methylideneamino] imidazole-4-carboxamide isomerase [Gemmatimonadales bacterium]|nr:1-(5-phosphoribosyl)-5-[(5-phosphoribosylamino)methylideneamino] imidazole-4-carboxamide isomerase [Gemmatimonadales bacterium]